jgi:hypothetical protein
MAERVTSDAPAWEKSGNVTWVQCPKCRGWLPVDPKLAASDAIKMVCPHCSAHFGRNEALRVLSANTP